MAAYRLLLADYLYTGISCWPSAMSMGSLYLVFTSLVRCKNMSYTLAFSLCISVWSVVNCCFNEFMVELFRFVLRHLPVVVSLHWAVNGYFDTDLFKKISVLSRMQCTRARCGPTLPNKIWKNGIRRTFVLWMYYCIYR